MRQRLIPLCAVVLATTSLTACGNKKDVVREGETEASYVDVGPKKGPFVKYQVQVSRQLNPGDFTNKRALGDPAKVDPEDSEYFRGLSASEVRLAKGAKPIDNEVYFGVFVAAYNENKKPAKGIRSVPLSGFEIVDTQENKYEPIEPADARNPPNPFLYRQAMVPAKNGVQSGVLPAPDSPAGTSTTGAELLIFKIPASALENRPLVLHIKDKSGEESEVNLDV